MAIYASFSARATRGLDLATLGAISAPHPCLAPGQLHIASSSSTGNSTMLAADRPASGRRRPKAVHAGTPSLPRDR